MIEGPDQQSIEAQAQRIADAIAESIGAGDG
jgi:hypothetical protein